MYLKVNNEKITPEAAEKLVKLCPFSAIEQKDGKIEINSACKLCKLCVKKGPEGAIELVEDEVKPSVNKDEWVGVTVYADHDHGKIHNVTLELLGKAKELAKVTGHPVYALLIGSDLKKQTETLLSYGADKVFVYDDPALADFDIIKYANVFTDFINNYKPSAILVGATNVGRSLAPRVAARFRTGLTADCTVLQMKENTDLVQIRPAFGGNIMAQIITPNNRPQFCTVRYKIFSAPEKVAEITGEAIKCDVTPEMLTSATIIEEIIEKPKESDISEAETIVAVGRGIKTEADLELAKQLADVLGASLACTRPLVENGWFDPKQQIGLSGKTVKPKLIITLGVSGSVQFAAGMKSSDCIVSINTDKNASIFDISHYCIVGDLYKVVPSLIEKIKEAKSNV